MTLKLPHLFLDPLKWWDLRTWALETMPNAVKDAIWGEYILNVEEIPVIYRLMADLVILTCLYIFSDIPFTKIWVLFSISQIWLTFNKENVVEVTLFNICKLVYLRSFSIRISAIGALSICGGCLTTLKLPCWRPHGRTNRDREVWSVPSPSCSIFPRHQILGWRSLSDNPLPLATQSMQHHEKFQLELWAKMLLNSWFRRTIRDNK